MLTGNVDLSRVIRKDIGAQLAKDPRFAVTSVNGLQYYFFALDAVGRSAVAATKNIRVRQAIAHAINRGELKKDVVVGGESAFELKALCIQFQTNCKTAVGLPAYDPAKAKKLMAEAGYANGFDVRLTAISRTRSVAEAVSGYLRKIGIRASIHQVTFPVFRGLVVQGKAEAYVMTYGSSGIADAGTTAFFHFIAPSRDYAGDKRLRQIARTADTILDPARRAKLIQEAFDRNNKQLYIIPLAAAPQVFIHAKELAIPTTTLNGYVAVLNQLKWK